MNVRYDAPMEMPSEFPEEMPNQKELEKEEVSIIPVPLINPKEEWGNNNWHYRTEKRLEVMPPLPIVVLPWKKSRKTLDNWVKKEMWNFPETWRGFFVYFDGEPVNDWKVDGYVVELSTKWLDFDFEFRNRYYKVSSHKFDKIEWAKSSFNYIDSYNNGIDGRVYAYRKLKSKTSDELFNNIGNSKYTDNK